MIDLLIRLYPRRWRSRYGEELRQLVADTGLGPRAVGDILVAAARERQRAALVALSGGVTMTIGPAQRHPNAAAVVAGAVLAPTAMFVIGSSLAYSFGMAALVPAMEAVNAWLNSQPRIVDLALVLAPPVALLVTVLPLVRLELKSGHGGEIVVGVRLRTLNVVVGLVAVLIGTLLVSHIVVENVLYAGG